MSVNVHVKWNMSAQLKGIFRVTLDNLNWRVYVVKLNDQLIEDDMAIMLPHVEENHEPILVSYSPTTYVWFVVCGLETIIQKILGIQMVDTCDIFFNFMAPCVNPHS